MAKREQSKLEIQFSDISHKILFYIFRRYWKLKTQFELIQLALYQFKYSSEKLFNSFDSGLCECRFRILGVNVGVGSGQDKKEAQNSAVGDAYLKLVKPYCRVVQTEVNELNLETSNTPFLEILNPVNAMEEFLSGEDFHEDNLKGLGDKRRTERDLSKFIIVRTMGASHSEAAPMAVLQSSSLYSGMMFQMDFGFENGEFTCTVAIEGHETATASSDQKQKVRTLAAEKSLEYLSQTCWTLLIKRHGKKSENMTREIVELEIEKHEKLRRESFDQSGQIQEKEMTFMNRKNLPIRPPGFKIHFEEAVQKTLNEHMISKRDIAFYDFERHEMKKIRKITKVYDNFLVKEMIADNKNCLVVSQVVLGEDSNMKGIGVSGDYFLEHPKIAPVHQFQGNCRPNNVQEGLKTASIQNKKEDTRDESECTLYSVKQEIGTSACSVNHCTIKQENSVRDKFACPHTISVGQVSQATVKEEQTMKKEQPSQYHADEDYNHFSTQENIGLKRPSTTNYQDNYDIAHSKILRISDIESVKAMTQNNMYSDSNYNTSPNYIQNLQGEGHYDSTGYRQTPYHNSQPPPPTHINRPPLQGHHAPQGHNRPQLQGHHAPQGHNRPQLQGHYAPQGHNRPQLQGHHAPQGHNRPQLQGHHAPQGHNRPPLQGHHAPQGHNRPPLQGHHAPQGHNRPPLQGHHAPQGHNRPQLQGHCGPQGYNRPQGFYRPYPPHQIRPPFKDYSVDNFDQGNWF